MGYNVAHNPIGTMPNAPLASAPGKELHPPKLSTVAIHGGQVKIGSHTSARVKMLLFVLFNIIRSGWY